MPEVVPKSHFKTRVGNGSAHHVVRIDERSLWARRTRELVQNVAGDLGGLDRLSETQRQLIRRLAGLCVICEQIEIELSQGDKPDSEALKSYLATINTVRRLSQTLGLARVPKDITPDLESYLAANYPGDEREASD